ncbi:MAG: amidohydrolase [Gammaproteobacteria bacterium]|nr:amidohydrolase [Gammaproteobacteria bacterium]
MRAYQVIDADGHVVEPLDMWDRYFDDSYRKRKPKMVTDAGGHLRFELDGRLWPTPSGPGAGRPEGLGAFYAPDSAHRREGGWDATARLADMDREGIDIMVLYPSLLLMGVPVLRDAGLAEAVCQAYNNWLHEHCKTDPTRLIGVGLIPLQHVEVACREAERCVRSLGMRGVMAHPAPSDERNLDHVDFDRLYATMQALDAPLAFHEGGSGHQRTLSSYRYDNYILTHTLSHPFEQMAACANMIVGGVFERFPSLQVAYLEAGCGWLPSWLDRLDEHVARLHHLAPSLRLSPSEYFQRQCWISCDPDERTLASTIALIGDTKIVWASDYPHLDARSGPVKTFHDVQASLAPAALKAILQDNPRRLYGLSSQ